MSKQFTFEAIGTQFWIEIFDETSDKELESTQSRLEFLSSDFNKDYSRFRVDSFISTLNRERSLKNPSEECRALLTYGKELYARTAGSFNILTGHILEARGYDATYSFTASDTVSSLKLGNPLTDLIISENEIKLMNGNIDLGGYGKGYLIDRLVDDLLAHDIRYFIVNGGGDMYATSDRNNPISIYLEHPTNAGQYLIETTLQNQGFAASSPFKRQWVDKGETYTHVVSENEVPKLATFVKAKNATDADAFATACLLLGETALLKISELENISFARFNPLTNEFWQTSQFNPV